MNIELTLKDKYPKYLQHSEWYDQKMIRMVNIIFTDSGFDNMKYDDVVSYYNTNQIKIDGVEKESLLRTIRDNTIMATMWVMQRQQGELFGLQYNLTQDQPTLSEAQFKTWLLYWQALRDLPQSINVNNYSLDQIKNMVMFPKMPEVL